MPNPLTQEEFLRKVENNTKRIDKFDIIGKYHKSTELVEGVCRVCGTHSFRTANSWVSGKRGCKVCAHNRAMEKRKKESYEGFLKFLKDNDLHYIMVTPYIDRKTKITFYCEDCGNYFDTAPGWIKESDYRCPHCNFSDGISFPNKVIKSIMRRSVVEYKKFEYGPIWADGKAYDCFFILNSKKYIIEADGEFHKKEFNANKNSKVYKLGKKYNKNKKKRTLEETKKIDAQKDQWAKEHNIEMIRIDCDYDKMEDVIVAFKNSRLKDILDFSNFNWDEIAIEASKNLVIEVCKYRVEHPELSRQDIADVFGVCECTIKNYMVFGRKHGLIPQGFKADNGLAQYDFEGLDSIGNGTPTCVKNKKDEILFIVNSCSKAKRILEEQYNFVTSAHKIGKIINSNIVYKGYKFEIATQELVSNNLEKVIN